MLNTGCPAKQVSLSIFEFLSFPGAQRFDFTTFLRSSFHEKFERKKTHI